MNKVIKLPKSNTKGRNSTISLQKSSNYFLFHKWYVKNADFPNHGALRYGGLLYKMESFVTMVNVCQSLVPVAKLSNLHRYHISRNTLYADLRLMPWLDSGLISWLDSEGLQYFIPYRLLRLPRFNSQPVITCSKLTRETLKQSVKYVQN